MIPIHQLSTRTEDAPAIRVLSHNSHMVPPHSPHLVPMGQFGINPAVHKYSQSLSFGKKKNKERACGRLRDGGCHRKVKGGSEGI